MKIRQGFVSNSSSSSFIVAFKKRPQSSWDVGKALFQEGQGVTAWGDEYVSADEAAAAVWHQLKDQRAASRKKVIEAVRAGYFPGYPEYSYRDTPKFDPENREPYDTWWKQFQQKCDKKAAALAEKFLSENQGAKFYIFSFSDNDGPHEAILEHGDTFKNAPHLTISHH